MTEPVTNSDVRRNKSKPARRSVVIDYLKEYTGLLLVLVGLVAFFGFSTAHFFSPATFRTIANQVPEAIVIAVGMTFVLLIGGIDLSVGSVLALGGAVLGICLTDFNLPLPVAILTCLSVGTLCGAMNGWVSVRWPIPSFIVTLGMLEIARGGAYLVTNSQTKYIGGLIESVTEKTFLGLSPPFWFAILAVIVGQLILKRTLFGRYMVAVGTNEEATRLSGIKTWRIRLTVFILSGLLASIGAVIHCARLSSADPNAGTGYELQAIAAVVIGGTSLMGGRGSVVSSFFGVLIIAVLEAGLAQMGAQEPAKRVITGCVIVAAVILDYYRTRRPGFRTAKN